MDGCGEDPAAVFEGLQWMEKIESTRDLARGLFLALREGWLIVAVRATITGQNNNTTGDSGQRQDRSRAHGNHAIIHPIPQEILANIRR